MVVNNYRPDLQDNIQEKAKRKPGRVFKWILLCLLLLIISIATTVVIYEVRTSRIQASEISGFAATLTYNLEAGPSNSIVYPKGGPFDKRLGYAHLPKLLDRVQAHGMNIEYQTRFSPDLLNYASRGYFIPYKEKTQTGLYIKDSNGTSVYKYTYPGRIYTSFDSVPALMVQSLLFIENRDLLDSGKHFMNPAVDWVRFSKASLHEAGNLIGLEYKTIGGSTLATQMEKFRHSPGGITVDAREKMRQMVSASVRAYQAGPKTLPARKDIVLSYLNSVPLSGAPGYGEVHGIGDGLKVWFDSDMDQVNMLLNQTNASGDTLLAKGQALRQVLSLMIAQRRPTYYLGPNGRDELNELTGSYLRLLAGNGYISPQLRDAGLAQHVNFRDFSSNPAFAPRSTDKGSLVARTHLSELLGKPLYDLDRMDLAATTTLQNDLQEQITNYLSSLNDPEFASSAGVLGKRMLSPGRTQAVLYSFTLFERTPYGNLVRVQTDNTDQPFDINEGSKLELGSTAKLRVLITYLEIIAEIHKRYAEAAPDEVRKALREPQDNLSRWVLQHVSRAKDKSLGGTLTAALERRYSANPGESFFTGGGRHYFHNFSNDNNHERPTVREAFQKSINLSFVRLMRDIVSYTMNQQVGSTSKLLADVSDPRRRLYLERFADREGKIYLRRFWNKYEDKTQEERFSKLLDGLYHDEVRLAAVHRYLYPETDYDTFHKFLHQRLPNEKIKDDRVLELYERYGPEAYNLSDQGYISKTHPLELWLLSYLKQYPDATWSDAVAASEKQRQEIYTWLFRTKYKRARDSRIRTMLELDAYDDIQKRWARLGYPFERLVPSLATALGSSGDRPEALAELMGIVMSDGVRQRTIRIEEIHFAALTPYETSLKFKPLEKEQVMEPAVAGIVREVLTEVVDVGTARRLQGGFMMANGTALSMGGKTGTGDNRFYTLSARGYRIASRAVNRTATFVFFLGDSHFGTLTAFVPGHEAADFRFTSSLPVQVLRGMAPILEPYLEMKRKTNNHQVPEQPKEKEPQIILAENKAADKSGAAVNKTPLPTKE
ncbi:membrane peptidoglycan carboxypeptidase [Pontibacter aydingkolensis]|uniref:peptidoglycan glycosyltransferase n=1 Tax=Pontibacter aydingkolensis TaxID=1911536 RepID=A0ABS7CY00_9BACT|nr:transglycosylase domain-containing protein [Pontibacter aydingkolensis]MBW7468402.1 transglycosylase domain-containing protein [Pontibacter aydingkolensis]